MTEIKNRITRDFRKSKNKKNPENAKAEGEKEKDAGQSVSSQKSGQKIGKKNKNNSNREKNSKYEIVSKTQDSSDNNINSSSNAKNNNSNNKKKNNNKVSKKNVLRIIPLGGLNEIGKNITIFEYNNEILIVDCGMSFPEEDMYGIDIVIADYDYLDKNSHKIKGMIVTHGHEDHIGGIPYLLKQVKMPVYGSKLTLGLIESKLTEHGIKKVQLKPIKAGQKFKLGVFGIEAIRVTHSIADALCFAITTPVGLIFHTGDFKIDYTPVDGEPIDFQKIAEIGKRGVLLLMSDSTNAVRSGYTESEQHLEKVMDDIFKDSESRIIVATFASNVHRIQTIIDTAMKYKRKVALSGRSMLKVLDLAMEMGYINIPKNIFVDINDINNYPDKKIVIVSTGSQGEPMSALARIANNDHKAVSLKKGDKIILSSSPIPGNEKSVSNIVNKLLSSGAEVIYSDIADIHVSGHACQEELKLMLTLIKPKYFLPVHGEFRHLHQHAVIAQDLGMKKQNIFVLENGNIIETDGQKLSVLQEKIEADPVFVDGLGVGDISTIVLNDRKVLSESGLIIVVATVDPVTGRIISGPEIMSRGFVYVRENEDLIEELRQVAAEELDKFSNSKNIDQNHMKNAVRNSLRNYIYKKTHRSPIILTIFMDA